jgi:DNA-binding IscR family transcriptional regulator
VSCATHKYYERCQECEDEETCSVRDAFLKIRNETVEMMKRDTIDDLVKTEFKLKQKKKRKK